jgi:phage-related protein
MAFDGTDDACWTPDIPTVNLSETNRLSAAAYGDGYRQRLLDGLDPINTSWSLTFQNRPGDVLNEMVDFLDAQQGGVFSFTDPGSGLTHRVYCDDWHVEWMLSRPESLYGTLTCTFTRAYGDGPPPAPLEFQGAVVVDQPPRAGKITVQITAGFDPYLDKVRVWAVPTGQPFDPGAWHEDMDAFSAQTFQVTVGADDTVNVVLSGPQPLQGRNWSGTAVTLLTHGTNPQNRAAYSFGGRNWLPTTTPDPTLVNWTSVCWSPELGLLMAVGNAGGNPTTARGMTSPDGINWTIRTLAAQAWGAVCWGGPTAAKLFVATAVTTSVNNIMSSPDGVTWTTRTKGTTNLMGGVCWSEELSLFVAVCRSGTGNRVYTSPQGTTWTVGVTPADNTWQAVCWSPTRMLFVAVASSGTNRVMTSPNGTTWTLRPTANDAAPWNCVCWSPKLGIFVAMAASGGTGDRFMWSSDGITWTLGVGQNISYTAVCWSEELNLFIATASSGTNNRIVYSTDGKTWYSTLNSPTTETVYGGTFSYYGVCWATGLGRFVAVSGTAAQTVTDDPQWYGMVTSAVVGEVWRAGATVKTMTLGTAGISFATGNLEQEKWPSPMTAVGKYTARYILTEPAGWAGLITPYDTAATIEQLVMFKETPTCLPQGTWDLYLAPMNAAGVLGPVTGPLTGLEVI